MRGGNGTGALRGPEEAKRILAAHDQLPPRLREALRNARLKQSSEVALREIRAGRSEEEIIALIVKADDTLAPMR